MTNFQYWTAVSAAMPDISPLVAMIVRHLTGSPFKQCFQAALVMGIVIGGLLWLYVQAAFPLNGIPMDGPAFGAGQ